MDRKTTINSKLDHPYKKFQGTFLWERVDRAVTALAKNGDIQETTRREYIVGYICKTVSANPTPKAKSAKKKPL